MQDFFTRRYLVVVSTALLISVALPTLAPAEEPTYQADSFAFKIPAPWHYAIPIVTSKKNVARCFLKSKLRLTAKGRLVVDAGRAAEEMPRLLDSMASRMVPAGSNAKVSRRKEELDGVNAILLTSETKDYQIPCAVIVCMRNERLYMAMLSIAETEDLKHRDSMVQSVLNTWSWNTDSNATDGG